MKEKLAALVFDAYGTLFDVHSITACAEASFPGKGGALSALWRGKQLEYTWLLSLMRRYNSFDHVTLIALRYACESLALRLTPETEDDLLSAYRRLSPFPDAGAMLERLQPYPLAILSNGTLAMLETLLDYTRFASYFSVVLSVDTVRVYKPDPRVYQLACDHFACAPAQIGFISSNNWDAAGAKAFGYRVFWVNRAGAVAERLGYEPDAVVPNLAALNETVLSR